MRKKLLGVFSLAAISLFSYNEFSTHNAEAANDQQATALGDLQVEIHSVNLQDKLVDGTGFYTEKPHAKNSEFVVIEATVTNTSLTQLELDTQLVYNLVTSNGAIYEPTAIQFNDFFGVEAINPGVSMTGQLAFEVPAGLQDYELQLEAYGTVSLP